jgi:hypothetical protein
MKGQTKLKSIFRQVWHSIRTAFMLVAMAALLSGSILPPSGLRAQVFPFTRQDEFDFAGWTIDALVTKFSSWALSLDKFTTSEEDSNLVLRYLDQVQVVNDLNRQILLIYADPAVKNPDTATLDLRNERDQAQQRLDKLAPLAESILQSQLMSVINQSGLGALGQVLPPSLYKVSDIPYSLVLSPRTEIKQALDISLEPGLETEMMEQIETQILQDLDYAALVVPIGGIGTYPTMVMQTTNIVWLTEVIAHEWIHNYLTLRPLGINYFTSPELRTLNETVASMVGKELGLQILKAYYPEYVPAVVEPAANLVQPNNPAPVFDFRAEMRQTRVKVDSLLEQGEVEAAEEYMEERRQFFWENGYLIRKLNQAYFAFYGAYNDQPGGGASGEDPIGPAVVAYREQFDNLADFLRAISWVNSFEELQNRLTNSF